MPATTEVVEKESVNRMIEALEQTTDNWNADWSMVAGGASATYSGGPIARTLYQTALYDRDDGRFRPFYQTEYDLQRQRAQSRNLATFTSVAVGAMQALQVYVMGGNWKYEVEAREGVEPNENLIGAIQRTVDEFLERNEWVGDFDREIHAATREDGESLVALYPDHQGKVDARRLEPDSLREPSRSASLDEWLGIQSKDENNHPTTSWTFGVHTLFDKRMKRIDHTRHAGYHVVFDDGGKDWDYLPTTPQPHLGHKCGVLLRRNVIRTAKRGISDFWAVQVDLEREDKLAENLSVGAAVQAAIAYIRQHPKGTTSSDAGATITAALDSFSRQITNSPGRERSINRMKAGTVLDIPNGKEYHASPMGALRSNAFIDVTQAIKRRIGTRWLFPEYMISGDASNANFSSTLVSESPFVKAREADQNEFVAAFDRIVWRVVKIAHDHGHFAKYVKDWTSFDDAVHLSITPPPVATRDKAQQISELTAMYDRKLIDANEFRTETRREPKPEMEGQMKEDPPPMQPGQPGQTQPGMNPKQPSQQPPQQDTKTAALSAALESVQTTEEAKAILESMDQ